MSYNNSNRTPSNKNLYEPFLKAVIRTPLQSIKCLHRKSIEGLPALFLEGLYLSSPQFLHEFQKLINFNTKEAQNLDDTLYKYWVRSCTRCTPYGTLAGCGLINISEEQTSVILEESDKHVKRVRIDMDYLVLLTNSLLQEPVIRDKILWFPNNSIYETFDEYRYVEYSNIETVRNYNLTSVQKLDYISSVINKSENGATIETLADLLVKQCEVDKTDAVEFIEELITSQILISELEPKLTGFNALEFLIEKLSSIHENFWAIGILKEVKALLTDPYNDVSYYKQMELKLKETVTFEKSTDIFQTDLFLSFSEANLNKKIVEVIVGQVEDLLTLSVLETNNDLEQFKTQFYNKYEDKEVSLSIALDSDVGIGYGQANDSDIGGSDFINDLYVNFEQINLTDFNHIQEFALLKYNNFLINSEEEIQITEDEVKSFSSRIDKTRFPTSMYIMGTILTTGDTEKINPSNFIFDLNGVGGPSAANLMSRFTYGNDEIYEFSKTILQEEEKEFPDSIYAEIVHLPQARLGNILLRPVLRHFEIPYVGISGADKEHQITVDDLLVSIKNGLVQLRSKKLNKFIIPRLTTAHNYHYRSLPIYKFLCDLQRQGAVTPVLWDWGKLKLFKHLPRVCYKNLIVSPAQWVLEEEDLKTSQVDGNKSDIQSFCDLCNKNSVPKLVQYTEGDNNLLIDFDNEQAVRILIKYLRRHGKIIVLEYLPNSKNCIVEDIGSLPFTNQLIIPIKKASETKILKKNTIVDYSIQEKFHLNSEWLYFKIYCGPKTMEKVLIDSVLPFVEENHDSIGLFDKFYFIRFKDEFNHLRVRFYNQDITKQNDLQNKFVSLISPYIQNGIVDKIIIDCYNREMDRYLPYLIEDTESLFFQDSIAALKIASLLKYQDNNDKDRILIAILGIDMMLNDFQLSLALKYELLRLLQKSYFDEFGGHISLQKQLNSKFRELRSDIFILLDSKDVDEGAFLEARTIFEERSLKIKKTIESIYAKISENETNEKLLYLLPSYIHMFVNRIFIAQQRKYELLIYHLLERYFLSKIKQVDKKGKVSQKVS